MRNNAFSDISWKTKKDGSSTGVITDGAPVCPRLCKGIFCTKKKMRRCFCSAHSIGGMWRLSKICVPLSSSTKKTDVVMCHLRQWQRHWCNSNKDFGYALSKAIRPRQRKKGRAKKTPLTAFSHNGSKICHVFYDFFKWTTETTTLEIVSSPQSKRRFF